MQKLEVEKGLMSIASAMRLIDLILHDKIIYVRNSIESHLIKVQM